jgi:hypothetical protein
LLSLLGMLLGLGMCGYGAWLSHLRLPNLWGPAAGIPILSVGGLLAGMSSALRPSPAGHWQTWVVACLPALAGLLTSLAFTLPFVLPEPITAAEGFALGVAMGVGLLRKRLDAQPRTEWLWVLHTLLSTTLFVGVMPAYWFLATLH